VKQNQFQLEQIFRGLLQLEWVLLHLGKGKKRITSGFVAVYRTPKKPTGAKTTVGGVFASVGLSLKGSPPRLPLICWRSWR